MSEPRAVLRAWVGSEPGRSLRIKGAQGQRGEKEAGIVSVTYTEFTQVLIATTAKTTMNVYVLEPADTLNYISWGSMGVAGYFKIVQRIVNTRDAVTRWHAGITPVFG